MYRSHTFSILRIEAKAGCSAALPTVLPNDVGEVMGDLSGPMDTGVSVSQAESDRGVTYTSVADTPKIHILVDNSNTGM